MINETLTSLYLHGKYCCSHALHQLVDVDSCGLLRIVGNILGNIEAQFTFDLLFVFTFEISKHAKCADALLVTFG